MAFPVLLIVAAIGDLRHYRIPNRLCLLLFAAFPVAALAGGMAWVDLAWHLGAAVSMLVAGFLLFQFGLWGGGDAKLLAAAAAWTGFAGLPMLLTITALAGGPLAVVALILRREKNPDGTPRPRLKQRVPYGVAIAIAGLYALYSGQTAVNWEFFLS